MILTVSRIEAEKECEPGLPRVLRERLQRDARRSSSSSGRSCSRSPPSLRAKRRDVRPRGHRGGIYPLMRAAMCVIVRDLIVYGVLQDMMRGRPAVYATFSSYDEVAHHSGLERAGHARGAAQARPAVRPDRPRPTVRAAPVRDRRPLRPRPDAGRDLQAAQRLRPRRARASARSPGGASTASPAATSRTRWSATRSARPPARARARRRSAGQERRLRPGRRRARVGQPRPRLPDGGEASADAGGDRRAPPATCCRRSARIPHVGWVLVRSSAARRRRARRRGHALPLRGPRRGRRPARGTSRRRRPSTCSAPTASRTSPT